jgi:hypothetical protein
MIKKSFLFGVIASVLSINAYAVSATVTSKDYVDTNFQTKIPSGTDGTIVTYTDTAGTLGERGVYSSNYAMYASTENNATYGPIYKAKIPSMEGLSNAIKWVLPANGVGGSVKNMPSGERIHFLPEFSDTNGKLYRLRTVNSVDEDIASWNTYNVIPTLAALDSGLETKQDKMTCAQYIENAEATPANCLLWNLPD